MVAGEDGDGLGGFAPVPGAEADGEVGFDGERLGAEAPGSTRSVKRKWPGAEMAHGPWRGLVMETLKHRCKGEVKSCVVQMVEVVGEYCERVGRNHFTHLPLGVAGGLEVARVRI